MSERSSDEMSNIPLSALRAVAAHDFTSVMITEGGSDSHEHKIVYVNDAFTRLTGHAPVDVVGRTPELMQGPKTDPKVIEELRNQISRGEPFHGQATNYRKDGTEFTIEWKVIPVRSEHGNVTHHVAVQRDVTSATPVS